MSSLCLLSAGSNAQGQLGHSGDDDSYSFLPCRFLDAPSGSLPPGTQRILSVATGANHTMVLLEIEDLMSTIGQRREVWGCGDSRQGQLGLKYQESSRVHGTDVFQKLDLPLESEGLGEYELASIAAGWETSYLVLHPPSPGKADVLVSFGSNDFGDLGVGLLPAKQRSGSVRKKEVHHVTFDHIAIEGKPLSDFGAFNISSVAASQHHVAAILDFGETKVLVGWGAARQGQIGPPPIADATRGGQKGDRPRAIPLDVSDIHDVHVGSQHTLVRTSSGRAIGLGSNRKGQLDLPRVDHVAAVGCTWNGSYALLGDVNGQTEIHGVGKNTHGQLGRGQGDSAPATPQIQFPTSLNARLRASKLSCGTEHVLTLWKGRDDTEAWGWGWNEHGNLGLGDTQDVYGPTKVWPNEQTSGRAVDIWTGSGTSWVLVNTA
ncbi:regulator of chromosome condensation 1/beta-lactamase-inhibitor protein II [Coprinopsis sp. MPI-PUGE-AT-0042]|nr:regulator of chromosome condensation 1/beta-lactamase-inhibitor protein II [Coprinopsis sp. MPI-PUGE-AT-0042]